MSDNLIKLSGFAWCKLFDAKIVIPWKRSVCSAICGRH